MSATKETPSGEVLLYEAPDGQVRVDVRLEQETVWLSLNQMAELFGRDKSVISRHLRTVFASGELERAAVVAKNATTAADGKTYQVEYFNLDAILSVGYRVNSKRGTQFRIWATRTLRDHLLRGYTFNERRLAERGLLEARQTLDLLARTLQNQTLVNDTGLAVLDLIVSYADTLGVCCWNMTKTGFPCHPAYGRLLACWILIEPSMRLPISRESFWRVMRPPRCSAIRVARHWRAYSPVSNRRCLAIRCTVHAKRRRLIYSTLSLKIIPSLMVTSALAPFCSCSISNRKV